MQRIASRTVGLGCGLMLLCASLAGCSSKAQDWTFTDSQGTIRSFSDYEGQVIVIGFSNTWCDPCQEAALHMQAIQNQYAQQGVKVLSVSAWDRGNPEEWMAEKGYTYGVMLNGTEIAREYKVDRVPTFLVVGVDGKVIYRHEGFNTSTPNKIAKVVDKHLRKHGRDVMAQHNG